MTTSKRFSLHLALVLAVFAAACGVPANEEDVASSDDALVAGPGSLVVDESMLKVSVGMKEADVKRILGVADDVDIEQHEILGTVEYHRYGKTKIGIAGGRVASLFTTSTRVRTANDMGVGTVEVSLKTRIPEVECKTQFGSRSCDVGASVAGRVVTSFAIADGKVESVRIARIVD